MPSDEKLKLEGLDLMRAILLLPILIILMITMLNCGGSESSATNSSNDKADSMDTSADRFKDEPTDAAVSMSPGEFVRVEDTKAKRAGLTSVLLKDGTA